MTSPTGGRQRQPDPHLRPADDASDGGGGFTKDQFMGCDGNTPNVICPNRISPLIRPWLAALPTPTSGGPLNNYLGRRFRHDPRQL